MIPHLEQWGISDHFKCSLRQISVHGQTDSPRLVVRTVPHTATVATRWLCSVPKAEIQLHHPLIPILIQAGREENPSDQPGLFFRLRSLLVKAL